MRERSFTGVAIRALALAWLLAGCDMAAQMEESAKHAAPIETEIEHAAGKRPHVFCVTTGPILVVSAQFFEVPVLSVPALEQVIRAAVVREFKKEPSSLTISFIFPNPQP